MQNIVHVLRLLCLQRCTSLCALAWSLAQCSWHMIIMNYVKEIWRTCRQVQSTFSTAGGAQLQLHCRVEEVKKNTVPLWFPGSLGGGSQLNAAAPCDSSDHLCSDRVYLGPWLLGLVPISHVGSVGTGHLAGRGSRRVGKRRETRHPSWKPPHLGTDRPGHIPPLKTDAVSECSRSGAFLLGLLWMTGFYIQVLLSATGLWVVTAATLRCTSSQTFLGKHIYWLSY